MCDLAVCSSVPAVPGLYHVMSLYHDRASKHTYTHWFSHWYCFFPFCSNSVIHSSQEVNKESFLACCGWKKNYFIPRTQPVEGRLQHFCQIPFLKWPYCIVHEELTASKPISFHMMLKIRAWEWPSPGLSPPRPGSALCHVLASAQKAM